MDRITELDKVLFGTTGNLRINAPNKISLTAKNIINKINNGDFIINNINGKTLILNGNNNCLTEDEIQEIWDNTLIENI